MGIARSVEEIQSSDVHSNAGGQHRRGRGGTGQRAPPSSGQNLIRNSFIPDGTTYGSRAVGLGGTSPDGPRNSRASQVCHMSTSGHKRKSPPRLVPRAIWKRLD